MLWLPVAISSYFIFAAVNIVDKYLLAGPMPSPRVYSFYMGILGILALALIPLGFSIPELSQIILSLFAGAIFILGLLSFYTALRLFEASRVIPAIGGLLPLFTFGLTFIFSRGKEIFSLQDFIALTFLILGSVIITLEKKKSALRQGSGLIETSARQQGSGLILSRVEASVTLKSLQISALTALLISLAFILTKFVYLNQPFWSGFIWIRIGGFMTALCFLFTKEVREEIFKKKAIFQKKTAGIFFSARIAGAGGLVLQNWAIALAPLAYLTIINALAGIEYAFILIFIIILSLKFPRILKENISGGILLQKILAVFLISIGLLILTFK